MGCLGLNNHIIRVCFFVIISICFLGCKTEQEKPFQNNNQIVLKVLERVPLKVLKGKYLSKKTKLIANSITTDQPEVFYLLYDNDEKFVIKSFSGHFLSYGQDSIIDANIKDKSLATKFLLVPHKQYFYLKTEKGLNVVAGEDLRLEIIRKH